MRGVEPGLQLQQQIAAVLLIGEEGEVVWVADLGRQVDLFGGIGEPQPRAHLGVGADEIEGRSVEGSHASPAILSPSQSQRTPTVMGQRSLIGRPMSHRHRQPTEED